MSDLIALLGTTIVIGLGIAGIMHFVKQRQDARDEQWKARTGSYRKPSEGLYTNPLGRQLSQREVEEFRGQGTLSEEMDLHHDTDGTPFGGIDGELGEW